MTTKELFMELLESTKPLIEIPPNRICKRCGVEKSHYHFIYTKNISRALWVCCSCMEELKALSDERKKIRTKNYKTSPAYKKRRNDELKLKRQSDPVFKLSSYIRNQIGFSFKVRSYRKYTSCKSILGCDFNALKLHFESLFQAGMNWDNMGRWHIDHKKPLAMAKSVQDVIELNHYTNLQPLWALDNLRKGTKIVN